MIRKALQKEAEKRVDHHNQIQIEAKERTSSALTTLTPVQATVRTLWRTHSTVVLDLEAQEEAQLIEGKGPLHNLKARNKSK